MCDKIISKNPFMLKYYPDKYITQKISDKAVDDFLQGLNFVLDCFVTSKMVKSFLFLCMQMEIYSILMKILVMLYSIVMKQVFLIYFLIMIVILMKMILVLSFMSDFWLGILKLKNAKDFKI